MSLFVEMSRERDTHTQTDRQREKLPRQRTLELLEGLDLVRDLLTGAQDIVQHGELVSLLEVILLPLDQLVDTVKGNTTRVANDTA